MNNELILELFRVVRGHSELDVDEIISAGRHGADSGFGGFTYNSDCIEFYDNNSAIIQEYVTNQAKEIGYNNWLEMVGEFNHSDMLDIADGYKILLSWYILEEVGRWLKDNHYDINLEFLYKEGCTIGNDFLMLFCDYTYGMDEVYIQANNEIDLLVNELSRQGYLDDIPGDDLSIEAEQWLHEEGVPYNNYEQYNEIIEFVEEILRQVLDEEKEKRGK